MSTHITIITTPNTLSSVGASYEAATLGVAVSVHVERTSATPMVGAIRGTTLPHGYESAWPAFGGSRFAAKGGLPVDTAPTPPVGMLFPNTPVTPNVNSTHCQSRGRTPLT